MSKVDYNKKRVEAYEYFVERFREHAGSYEASRYYYFYNEHFQQLIDHFECLGKKLDHIDEQEQNAIKKEDDMFDKVTKKEFEEFKKNILDKIEVWKGLFDAHRSAVRVDICSAIESFKSELEEHVEREDEDCEEESDTKSPCWVLCQICSMPTLGISGNTAKIFEINFSAAAGNFCCDKCIEKARGRKWSTHGG
jgi:hypothetical protein